MNGRLLAKTKTLQFENNDLRAKLAMPAADNDKALDLRDELMDESMVSQILPIGPSLERPMRP